MRPMVEQQRLDEWHPTCLIDEWRGFMHLYGNRVIVQENNEPMKNANGRNLKPSSGRLRAAAIVLLGMTAGMPQGFAQAAASQSGGQATNELPAAPTPIPTEPLYLR